MNTTEPRIGHGADEYHCSCHDKGHVVPSLAADCEDRTERAEEWN